jgi:7-cyano-7-deazaguanine tRNA-ribosyltransferase
MATGDAGEGEAADGPDRECFEISAQDALGRVGDLRVPRADATVTTPALLPVINPNRLTVDPADLPAFGAQALITNSYIVYGDESLRERARREGLHDLLDFPGAVVTDSGSFQLSEYGDIDVTTEQILRFQHEIGSDLGTPVDIPTGPDAPREVAERDLAATQDRLELAADLRAGGDLGEMLINGPVQGSTHADLRERAAAGAYALDLDVYPVGAMVPLLNDYRYAEVVDAVAAAKRGLGADAPVHLFGAGHPMTFALAAALGCDLFDSAAYAIYARDDRYLTVRGTEHLADLRHLPCACPVCADHAPDDLRALDDRTRERRLAEHNLHASFAEMRRIRQAIAAGNLLELVEARARGHPALLDGYRALLDHADQLERADPARKDAFFHVSAESARRPEVLRHRRRLDRLDLGSAERILLAEGGASAAGEALVGDVDETWRVIPPFGPCPPALCRTYPLNAETPDRMDPQGQTAAARAVARLVDLNPNCEFTLAHRGWAEAALAAVPDRVEAVDLSTDSSGGDADGGT